MKREKLIERLKDGIISIGVIIILCVVFPFIIGSVGWVFSNVSGYWEWAFGLFI